jgi:pyruvate/oxaloacetate carboxyltransferase
MTNNIKKIKLKMLMRGENEVGYKNYNDNVVLKFCEM